MNTSLLDAVVSAAARVPASVGVAMAKAIVGHPSPHALDQHASGLTDKAVRDALVEIAGAWERAATVTSGELASMVRTAGAARDQAYRDLRVDVVMTGPSEPMAPVRSTESVVTSLIDGARHRLLLVTYAAIPPKGVIESLKKAADRRVDIVIVVETIAGGAGLLHIEPALAFHAVSGVKFLHWPLEHRAGPWPGRLHAKVLVADRATAFVTSANLTGSALETNLECGLLVRSERVAGRIVDHFEALTQAGVLSVLELESLKGSA